MSDPKRIVAEGYDRIGDRLRPWFDATAGPVREWFLAAIQERVPEGSDVLELGCGAGVDAIELAEGRRYTGVDLSEWMISLARRRVPSGTFVQGDLATVAFPPASFDAVVSLYVFGHLPAEEHVPTFRRVFGWLRPGGVFCASFPSGAHEGMEETFIDVPMYFAAIGRDATESALREIGFHLEISEVKEELEPTGETVSFLWTIARKPA
jgi:ubiquinone/menaquinone biosynthesis C-methylase UbiE